jgi:ABC-type multidrug transport system ATPase subunit
MKPPQPRHNSEAKVQAALDKASKGCTTIIVAHRLSTIRGANKIVVISKGKVVEQGTHNELMSLKNEYYNLVTTQVTSAGDFENKDQDYDNTHPEVQRQISVVDEQEVSSNKHFCKNVPNYNIHFNNFIARR